MAVYVFVCVRSGEGGRLLLKCKEVWIVARRIRVS